MREDVKRLQPGRVAKVGRVRVRVEREVGVRRVGHGEVRGEVVEAAVVRVADEGEALEEVARGEGGGGGGGGYEDEAVFGLGNGYLRG